MAERPRPPSPRAGSAKERAREALAELVEVERAIAALEGRNVDNAEHLVVQRAEAEKRRAALEQIIVTSRAEIARRRKLLPYKIAGVVIALGAIAAGAAPIRQAVQARLDERARALATANAAVKPFERRLSILQTELGSEPFVVAATAGRCFVAVATTTGGGAGPAREPPKVKVERGGDARTGTSVGWCTCEPEEVRVSVSGPGPLAALVLQAPADAIGGADVLGALAPRPETTFPETVDRTCAEAAFDAWAETQPAEPPSRDDPRLPAETKALTGYGLSLAALGPEGAPFVLVPGSSRDACALLLRRDGGRLSLRRKGGERVLTVERGAVGLCARDLGGWSAWADGPADVAVFTGPRARVGGLLGLRDAAAHAKQPIAVWTPPDELDADARDALAASGISAALTDLAPKRPAVVSISTDVRSTLTVSDAGPGVACRPALDVGALQTLCVEARPRAFSPTGELPPGIARGPRPLWLALPDAPDAAALGRALDVMAFARRMSAAGFELTSLVGATFTPRGLKVTGRNREKEIVAIIVSSASPYLHTLSAGEPWPITDPRVTPLAPSDSLELVATPKLAPGRATREFVVWRR